MTGLVPLYRPACCSFAPTFCVPPGGTLSPLLQTLSSPSPIGSLGASPTLPCLPILSLLLHYYLQNECSGINFCLALMRPEVRPTGLKNLRTRNQPNQRRRETPKPRNISRSFYFNAQSCPFPVGFRGISGEQNAIPKSVFRIARR